MRFYLYHRHLQSKWIPSAFWKRTLTVSFTGFTKFHGDRTSSRYPVIVYYLFIDLRKIFRITVKIVVIFIQHPVILLIRTAKDIRRCLIAAQRYVVQVNRKRAVDKLRIVYAQSVGESSPSCLCRYRRSQSG